METLTIRPAEDRDSEAISILLGQLGYPSPAADIPRRIRAVTEIVDAIAIVAEAPRGEVVGLATARLIPSIHDANPSGWLTTLVVLESARGQGVGSQLVSFVEDWVQARGADRITVTSGKQRTKTHQFYMERGYTHQGLRFLKRFAAEQAP
ncbi:MAG TPA: GNAT family N-acetyltransferase [Gemmatimonadaceae bacterium]|jgi:GNAT superfamily N-acetyltransferase|nr:GNAT family N-acetyltransferase [Gemmatimonadaceae bacterium]